MIFNVQHDKTGRVFMDTRVHMNSTLIETIEADDWMSARLQVQELAYDKVDGYGWFLPESR